MVVLVSHSDLQTYVFAFRVSTRIPTLYLKNYLLSEYPFKYYS